MKHLTLEEEEKNFPCCSTPQQRSGINAWLYAGASCNSYNSLLFIQTAAILGCLQPAIMFSSLDPIKCAEVLYESNIKVDPHQISSFKVRLEGNRVAPLRRCGTYFNLETRAAGNR